MNIFLTLVAVFLLLSIAAGLVRVYLGPTSGDRMLSAQLFGTTGIAVLLIMSSVLGLPALLNVALVLGLLAAVAVIAFVTCLPHTRGSSQAEDGER